MSEKSKVRCATPRCIELIANYGESYHRVYDEQNASTVIAKCEGCGGKFNGDIWLHVCQKCKVDVNPGELTGLFVPHLCRLCEQKVANNEIACGSVCRMCHKPYSRCCC